ncbi:MAG: DegT/DnrJ/EryC1/StrS family aminotransferase [Elusimicrobia bacterium]|nr:DegT/DnrJ/EryC1/StrS family aminotransferase [Elusimicrobiota bacterium]
MAHLLRSRTLPAEIPIFNLTRQYQSLKKEINTALRQVYANSQFIQGPNVKLFAEKFAHYCEVRYCIPVANGTDALYLSLRALGIGPGDEVITSAFSFIAAAEAIVNAGATPIFADIDPLTFTISPDSVKTLVSSKTKALIPVHLYGLPADMDTLINIAQQNHLAVIEDAAQAHGARYKNRPSGSIGRTGCFSFYPTKNLGSFGDAGAVTTNDAALAQKIRSLANHGSGRSQYDHTDSGMNSRMDEIQAAILNVKLGYLEQWNRKRRQVAQYYSQAFSGISELTLPVEPPDRKHVFHLYTIRTPRRDLLLNYLKSQGVTTKIHYPAPLHLLAAYQKLAYASGSLPESECAAQEVLALPLFPEIKTSEVRRVCEAIKTFFKN